MPILLSLFALAWTPAALPAQYAPASQSLFAGAPAAVSIFTAPPRELVGVAIGLQQRTQESELPYYFLAAAYLAGSMLLVAGGATLFTERKRAAFVGGLIGGTVTVAGLSLAIYSMPSPGSTAAVGFLLWPPLGAAAGSLLAVQLAR